MRVRIVIIAAMLLSGLVLSSVIVYYITLRDSGIGLIVIDIEKKKANITVEMDTGPFFDMVDSDLTLSYSNENLPLSSSNNLMNTQMDPSQFEKLVSQKEVNITGRVEVETILSIKNTREIDEKVDLSFLSRLGESITVESVDLEIESLGYIVAAVNFTADIEQEVAIKALDTDARLIAGSGVYGCGVEELELETDGNGWGKVLIPMTAALSLGLSGGEVFLVFWGIKFSFPNPF